MTAFCPTDPNSFANCHEIAIRHSHLVWTADFTQKVLRGSVRHQLVAVGPASTLVLDTKGLKIVSVGDAAGNSLEYVLGEPDKCFGTPMIIQLGTKLAEGASFVVEIAYETTGDCTAIQWLEPSQTVGKVHPYLFTQCQAIHARSIVPCQDTPGVKITYSASVTVPSGLRALMSAVPLAQDPAKAQTFGFEQKIAIPSYLIALAVGEIVGIKVGPRSTVWSEPAVVKAAAWEFEDTESFIAAGESFLTPYCWGVYDLLVLPSSFPYGGMENPCLTFVTPTLLAGDRTLVDVVAHEIAHSWMGNLVTTKNWEHFWLNEGFTMFIQRKITCKSTGERERHFDALLGLAALEKDVALLCASHPEYTCLCPKLQGVDPDDVFSRVPYEKGFNLLFHLEKVVGGPAVFEPYVKHYVERFSHKSITTDDFKDSLFEYFTQFDHGSKLEALNRVDWEAWLHKPGMPPVDNEYDRSMIDECQRLATAWIGSTDGTPAGSWDDMSTNQRVIFLDLLAEKAPVSGTILSRLDSAYALSANNNAEVKFKWHSLCLASGKTDIYPHVVAFITSAGRMKYVRPLYRALASTPEGKALAIKTFDPNSFANCHEIAIRHSHLVWTADFTQKVLRGSVRHQLVAVGPASTLVLDTKGLKIVSVGDAAGNSLEYVLGEPDKCFGTPMIIQLGTKLAEGASFVVEIAYETTGDCTAIQWLEPSQTVGKVHPYLFTQCQAIHARSIVPCQDTPGVKITYSASVTVPSGLRALMSAVPLAQDPAKAQTFGFEQKIAIPSYLIALAVGEIVGIKVGPRSTVWSEPAVVKAAAWEFEDTESFIAAGESFLTPYCWGVYDLLVLPSSFPYGGMENPCLTFVTPTLLAGDRTLVDVVAHEIAHSWMGNLYVCAADCRVTTKNWEHFWLNEGFTMFIQRKITCKSTGERERHFDALLGLAALEKDVALLCASHPEYTCLCPKLQGVDPDDVFSRVPYEKGFNLLFHLEKVVGGPAVFEPYVKHYVERFSHKSITTDDFKDSLFEYFTQFDHGSKLEALNRVDWEAWLHKPGMPPVDNEYDRSMIDECQRLATAWIGSTDGTPAGSWDDMSTNQRVIFLDLLAEKAPVSGTILSRLDSAYALSANNNAEVKFKWHSLCLASGKTDIYPHVVAFITSAGRMKYVRPLYRALASTPEGKALAIKTFEANRLFYHPICSGMVAKDLVPAQYSEANKPTSLPAPPRHEWYQSDSHVMISVFAKQVKDVQVELVDRSCTLTLSLGANREFQVEFDPLWDDVEGPATTQVLSTKVEVKLAKKRMGLRWNDLLGSAASQEPATLMTVPANAGAAHEYPSSSKKKKNWNQLDKSVEEDKVEGEQALNKLFKDIFANGSEETKRAMMKSFTESNGTALSTNWDEVGKKRVEVTPPDGMVAKPYEK
ncbi:Leukotriene A-4 hydrolase [Kappamyces sp. JEL0829]|nr:Leukotriene A-4 hydrolase [Kappamyces sp. JEL0829]